MWPALAKANGIDPKSITWVNVDANAKLAALKARSIDITTSFYNIHHIFQRELGDDMGFVAWRDIGLNPRQLGHRERRLPEEEQGGGRELVQVTQRAFAECVKQPKPCVQALVDANGAQVRQRARWELVK